MKKRQVRTIGTGTATGGVLNAGAARWQLFGAWGDLIGEIEITPVWLSDGARFAFVDLKGERVALVDPSAGRVGDLFDVGHLNEALGEATRRKAPIGLPFGAFQFAGGDHVIRFIYREVDWLFDIEALELKRVRITDLETEARAQPGTRLEIVPQMGWMHVAEIPSPDGRFIATLEGPDLAVRFTLDGRTSRLTDDGEELFRWSLTSLSTSGRAPLMWSPDSSRILAAKTDWRHVPAVAYVSWLGRNESVSLEPYSKAGERHEARHFHVIDVISLRRTPITFPFDLEMHTIQPVCWRENDEVVFLVNDVGGQTLMLVVADARTGASRVVVEEAFTVARLGYARGAATIGQLLEHGIAETAHFLWMSDRDGWNHLYLYSWDGTLVRQVTSGEYPVERVVAVDSDAGVVYFTARSDQTRPYDIHLRRVNLDGTGLRQLTDASGDHLVQIAPGFGSFLDLHSTVDRPHQTDLRDMDGNLITTLHELDTARLQGIGWTPPQEFCVKAADGVTDIYGVLFLPPKFDPSKRYPVVESIYGGPQLQAHPNSFELQTPDLVAAGPVFRPQPVDTQQRRKALEHTLGAWALRTAQLGFVTLVLDARGTPGRSRDYQQMVYGRMGQHEIADHAAAIRQLAETRPWMDLDRVGVFGRSWGGYMTLRALLQAPDLYKVGIDTAGVTTHDDLWGGASVIHNLPQVNPDGYRLGSNLHLADKLAGKLLIIQGTHDKNTPFASVMKIVHAFARAGKPVDMLFLAEMGHGPVGWEDFYVDGSIARYLVEHLHPDGIDADDVPLSEL